MGNGCIKLENTSNTKIYVSVSTEVLPIEVTPEGKLVLRIGDFNYMGPCSSAELLYRDKRGPYVYLNLISFGSNGSSVILIKNFALQHWGNYEYDGACLKRLDNGQKHQVISTDPAAAVDIEAIGVPVQDAKVVIGTIQ